MNATVFHPHFGWLIDKLPHTLVCFLFLLSNTSFQKLSSRQSRTLKDSMR